MSTRRSYPRHQSRLYKVQSPAQLAGVLQIRKSQLQLLEKAEDNYIRWVDQKTGRDIQKPRPLLERVHRRAGVLMSRIETPEFLHSAVRGRSYITNAARHTSEHPTVKVDIRKFYPSIRAQAVFHFFRDRMLCTGDVAGVLTRLLTIDGHLATGSSVSPILSYFAYEDMFSEIEAISRRRGCEMTCYVDDMVFTGPRATRGLLYEIIQVARRYRLWGHKTKVFRAGQPKVITGVAVTMQGLRLPNQRQQAIAAELNVLKTARTDEERLSMMPRLMGRLFEAAQVDATWRSQALQISGSMEDLRRRTAA